MEQRTIQTAQHQAPGDQAPPAQPPSWLHELDDDKAEPESFQLRLYVAGESHKSLTALANLKHLCLKLLDARYEIEVIDLVEHPQLAAGDEISAIPTLVRLRAEPMRKMVGDLSDPESVIVGLQLRRLLEASITDAPAVAPEPALPARAMDASYELTLFVSGASTSSARAIRDVQALCEIHLPGQHQLTVVDVNQSPELVRGRGVLATPTLLTSAPGPARMLVGDLSDHDRVMVAIGGDRSAASSAPPADA